MPETVVSSPALQAPATAPSRPRRRRSSTTAVHAVLTVGALLMVLPFAVEILSSLKTYHQITRVPPQFWPTDPHWENYREIFSPTFPVGRQLLNTVVMSVLRIAGQVLFCSLAAYVFARLHFPGKKVVFALFLSVLMVPGQLFLIPQYQIMQQLGWLDTVQALFVPGMFSAFGVFLLRQFFLTLPRELDEAATIDGCNPLQVYWFVLLPLLRPALVALSLLTLVNSWNDLLWPLIVNSTDTRMPVAAGLANLQGQFTTQYQLIMAGALLTTAPVIAVFAVLQKQFIAGVASSGLK